LLRSVKKEDRSSSGTILYRITKPAYQPVKAGNADFDNLSNRAENNSSSYHRAFERPAQFKFKLVKE
jgi:hypothetical protein